MQLPCALGFCLDMSENWAGWVHWEDLVTGTNKHYQGCCNREKSWILKNTFLIRVMEWRTTVPRTGEDRVAVRAGLLSQHPAARLAHYYAQCLAPVQTVTTNKGFQKKAHKKQKAVNLKTKRIKVSSQDGKNVKSQSSRPLQARKNPKTLSAPQVRDHLHRTLTLRELPSKLIWPFRRYTALFFSPLARG